MKYRVHLRLRIDRWAIHGAGKTSVAWPACYALLNVPNSTDEVAGSPRIS